MTGTPTGALPGTPTGTLADKVAVVTGGAHGIGREVCRVLADHGARVVVADIDPHGAESAAHEIGAAGGVAVAAEVDISDEQSVIALMTRVVQEFGALHVLCNNAALTAREHMVLDGDVQTMELQVWRRTLDVNLTGTMLCCKHAVPVLIESGGGAVINTSSGASVTGDSRLTAYGVSKAAVNQLTKSLATQYGRAGVRVNAICPAGIVTEDSDADDVEYLQSSFTPMILTPFLGASVDVANLTCYLASDDARYLTGQILHVDGGFFAHQPHIDIPS